MPSPIKKARLAPTPLLLISGFFAFSEVALNVGAFKTTGTIQTALTIFAIVFPLLISAMFFIFLWFRPAHLYSPTEYGADKSFLSGVTPASRTRLQYLPAEISSITAAPSEMDPKKPFTAKDMLLVIDVQNDFIDGVLAVAGARELIPGINQACIAAHRAEMIIAFTRDWHPTNHSSFKFSGGVHAVHEHHCVAGSRGAELHEELFTLVDHIIVDFGTAANTKGYSPLENSALLALVLSDRINKIYITGIAFEYCVQACCIDLRKLGKEVIAVEPLIAKTVNDPAKAQVLWNVLETEGVIRSPDIPKELQNGA
jgi:nicotinamidase/pyrazinamidase